MKTVISHLRVHPRANGPRGYANGGFAAGVIADVIGGTAAVRLHRRVPLDQPLAVDLVDRVEQEVRVAHDGSEVASAVPVEPFVLEPPVRPTFADAVAAREAHPLRGVRHALSHCVVCGPDRPDGMNVTPGPVPGHPTVLAAPFIPHELDATDGVVHPEAVWGALDCPSYPAGLLARRRLALLGTISVHRRREIGVGERLVVVGWEVSRSNRAHHTASVLLDAHGEVVASARAVWVELRRQRTARLLGRFL